jgi:outer membrane receptor protein involved in Fe transport
VQNLTDKAYSIGGITQMGALGFNTKIYAPPRTFGFDFGYHFGP